jgi:hypothetical protein
MAVAILMIGLWLGLVGLSTSEHLHQLVHPDAHHVQHECLLTFFHESQFLPTTGSIAVPVAVFVCLGVVFLPERLNFESIDLRLGASRAPPLVSCLLP